MSNKRLPEQTAEKILSMITIEKTYLPGDKLPNENDLSLQFKVSRTTLREAIRILITNNVLEIKRGKGTYVVHNSNLNENLKLDQVISEKVNLKDLMEMRLIFEPEIAYYAAKRATDNEIEEIFHYCKLNEYKIINSEERVKEEQMFHNSISKATHNEFINRLMPIINKAIYTGVLLSKEDSKINTHTLADHKSIMEYLKARDAEGARISMKLHILHSMEDFGITRID